MKKEDVLYILKISLITLTFPVSLPAIFVHEMSVEDNIDSIVYPSWKKREKQQERNLYIPPKN